MQVEEDDVRNDLSAKVSPAEIHPGRKHLIIVVAAVTIMGAIALISISPRVRARTTLRTETQQMAVQPVAVVKPARTAPADELTLPANVQAYITAPIYSRTNGYLRRWYVDIGTRVHKGQLLAEIETPEVDQQLRQARANLATARANLHLSEITARRYQDLLKSHSVAQQDTDNAVGGLHANQATVQANEANVSQLEQLQSFEKIYAPFDGVITARNTDVGALINSGSSGGPTTSLFSIAQPNKLRVYVNIPEAYSQAAKPGLAADLVLAEFPGRRFPGKLIRTANAIDPATRTLPVEIQVDNPTGTLFAGSYAEAHLKLPTQTSSFILPVNTLLFRAEGLRVAVVQDSQHATLVPIVLGHDFGNTVEVISGLKGDESVVLNPPDSIVSGEAVKVVQPAADGAGL